MKKYIKTVICSLAALMMTVTGASAADTLEMEWCGDYSDNNNPQLVVTFTSPALYKQQMTAVIYDADKTTPVYTDYLRVEEVTVTGNEETELTFKLLDEFSETDGRYTLLLQGSGYLQNESRAQDTVYVINKSNVPVLLAGINNATSATFEAALDKVMLPLQLTDASDAAIKAKRIASMIAMKTNDYSGAFATLEEVRESWKITDLLVYMNESNVTADGIAEKVEENAHLLGIDTGDADYIANRAALYDAVFANRSAYNNGAGVSSVSELQDIIGESLGLIAVNLADEETVDDAFLKYYSYFDISDETRTAYSKLNAANQGKALRAVYNKNLASQSELISAFTTAVTTLSSGGDTGGTPIIIVPGVSGGTTGGASITGGVSAPSVPSDTTQTTDFTDVPSSHWAYTYINALADKGIIGGYDDNTFRPENNVTREEFVKMIVGAVGIYDSAAECDFADVPAEAWYYRYVASGYAGGIIEGMDETTFGVGNNITRQDVAVIAARLIDKFGADKPVVGEAAFTDMESVSDYAAYGVNLLSGMGIINGFDDGSFRPLDNLTRAEAATIISKLIGKL